MGVFSLGLVRRADRHQLAFFELVLADQAARVPPGAAGLAAETGGERGHADGQAGRVDDVAGDQVGQAHFGGGDQIAAVAGLEDVFLELGQLPGAEGGILVHQQWGIGFGKAMARRVGINHILPERALQAGQGPLQHGKARAGDLGRGFGIVPQFGGDDIVFKRGEIKGARAAPAHVLDIAMLVHTVRHISGGQVGQADEQGFRRLTSVAGGSFKAGDFVFQASHFGLQSLRLRAVPGGHGGANLLGSGIAAGQCLLRAGFGRTALRIGGQQGRCRIRHPAPGERSSKGIRIGAEGFQIVHDPAFALAAAPAQAPPFAESAAALMVGR